MAKQTCNNCFAATFQLDQVTIVLKQCRHLLIKHSGLRWEGSMVPSITLLASRPKPKWSRWLTYLRVIIFLKHLNCPHVCPLKFLCKLKRRFPSSPVMNQQPIGTMKERTKIGFHYMRIIIVPLVKEANQPLQPPPDRQNQGDGQTQTCNLTKFWSSINSRALNWSM